ncbi:MAG: YdeI/OmpD-associated family protein [Verrucomicrobiales bacterium]|nr:YdeI/OmpD-associated family protein [Verrucomicrobiales bacterium]
MNIGEVFHPRDRAEWREWLETHHREKSEIWLRRYRIATGKPSVGYDDMVEECLCFGWIDGIAKSYCPESSVQRITPRRRKGTYLSELNRQRVWKLQRLGLMTEAGLAPIASQIGSPDDSLPVPEWMRAALQADPAVWETFEAFPKYYRRLKIGWVTESMSPSRKAETEKRLAHLIKMTAQGRRYGTEPLADWEG